MANAVAMPYTALTGAQKTAILILAVGEARGGELLARLSEDESRLRHALEIGCYGDSRIVLGTHLLEQAAA